MSWNDSLVFNSFSLQDKDLSLRTKTHIKKKKDCTVCTCNPKFGRWRQVLQSAVLGCVGNTRPMKDLSQETRWQGEYHLRSNNHVCPLIASSSTHMYTHMNFLLSSSLLSPPSLPPFISVLMELAFHCCTTGILDSRLFTLLPSLQDT